MVTFVIVHDVKIDNGVVKVGKCHFVDTAEELYLQNRTKTLEKARNNKHGRK